MAKIALTDVTIRDLPLPAKGQQTYFDASQAGFGVRVSQGGSKTFVAVLGKRRSYKTIDKYPSISLKMARQEAKRLAATHSSNPLERPAIRHSDAAQSFLEDCTGRNKA